MRAVRLLLAYYLPMLSNFATWTAAEYGVIGREHVVSSLGLRRAFQRTLKALSSLARIPID